MFLPNPATFLPESMSKEPEHNCQQVLALNYSAREDLKDTPLENPELVLFTDGSSFIEQGQRKAGYAVVTLWDTIECQPLLPSMSAQLAELIALTRSLKIGKAKRVNIYTDSKYAYLVLHAHAAIWKERDFLNSEGPPIKYHEITQLIQAVHEPKEVTVTHCRGHQKRMDEITEGNRRADTKAKEAARET